MNKQIIYENGMILYKKSIVRKDSVRSAAGQNGLMLVAARIFSHRVLPIHQFFILPSAGGGAVLLLYRLSLYACFTN